MRAQNFIISAFSALVVLAPLTSSASEVKQLPNGLYDRYAPVGGWALHQYSTDAAGKDVEFCAISWTRESDFHLLLGLNPKKQEFIYGLPEYDEAPKVRSIPMRVWFSGEKAKATERVANFIVDTAGRGYMAVMETIGHYPTADSLRKARSITFSYPFEGQPRVETFPLKGAAAAIDKLFACATGK